jgi:hypothetical protein
VHHSGSTKQDRMHLLIDNSKLVHCNCTLQYKKTPTLHFHSARRRCVPSLKVECHVRANTTNPMGLIRRDSTYYTVG